MIIYFTNVIQSIKFICLTFLNILITDRYIKLLWNIDIHAYLLRSINQFELRFLKNFMVDCCSMIISPNPVQKYIYIFFLAIVNIRLYKCSYLFLLPGLTPLGWYLKINIWNLNLIKINFSIYNSIVSSRNPSVTPEYSLDSLQPGRRKYLILLDSSTKLILDSVRIPAFSTW